MNETVKRVANAIHSNQGKSGIARSMNKKQAGIIAEIAAAAMLEWRPMSSAPGDGTMFLAKTEDGRLTLAERNQLIDDWVTQLDCYGYAPKVVAWSPIGRESA